MRRLLKQQPGNVDEQTVLGYHGSLKAILFLRLSNHLTGMSFGSCGYCGSSHDSKLPHLELLGIALAWHC